jgi:hypothetical protein
MNMPTPRRSLRETLARPTLPSGFHLAAGVALVAGLYGLINAFALGVSSLLLVDPGSELASQAAHASAVVLGLSVGDLLFVVLVRRGRPAALPLGLIIGGLTVAVWAAAFSSDADAFDLVLGGAGAVVVGALLFGAIHRWLRPSTFVEPDASGI